MIDMPFMIDDTASERTEIQFNQEKNEFQLNLFKLTEINIINSPEQYIIEIGRMRNV